MIHRYDDHRPAGRENHRFRHHAFAQQAFAADPRDGDVGKARVIGRDLGRTVNVRPVRDDRCIDGLPARRLAQRFGDGRHVPVAVIDAGECIGHYLPAIGAVRGDDVEFEHQRPEMRLEGAGEPESVERGAAAGIKRFRRGMQKYGFDCHDFFSTAVR